MYRLHVQRSTWMTYDYCQLKNPDLTDSWACLPHGFAEANESGEGNPNVGTAIEPQLQPTIPRLLPGDGDRGGGRYEFQKSCVA